MKIAWCLEIELQQNSEDTVSISSTRLLALTSFVPLSIRDKTFTLTFKLYAACVLPGAVIVVFPPISDIIGTL